MALQGTLADLGIVDLVQFPHAGRKSGELTITSSSSTAHLYYTEGALTHAEVGQLEGMDAVVAIVDLNEGAFEFHQDATPDRRTIELDLHRVVMMALKTRDEKRLDEERQRHEEEERRQQIANDPAAALGRLLMEFLAGSPIAHHISVLALNGNVLAQTPPPDEASDGLEELLLVLHDLRRNYPRAGLTRLLLEDAVGTVAVAQLEDGRAVVLVASRQAPMGAITVALKKLAEQLEKAA